MRPILNQKTRLAAGILFLVVAVSAITLVHINPTITTPTRSNQTRTASILKGLVKEIAVLQEMTAIKDYLTGVDLFFTHRGTNPFNTVTMLVLDTGYHILGRKDFPAASTIEGDLTRINLDRPLKLGKGSRFFLGFYSGDGTDAGTVSLLFNRADSLTGHPLWVAFVKNDDLLASARDRTYTMPGNLMVRTYETDTSEFMMAKYILYLLALLLAAVIAWYIPIRNFLARKNLLPEWFFAAVALPFAAIFAVITPPLQVPDEGSHFLKSYDVSEFHLFTAEKTSPVSLMKLDSAFMDLHFSAGKKVTAGEIRSHFKDRLVPGKRAVTFPPPYVVPYLPQAAGIFLGRMVNASPLTLMYLGRFFNLIVSIMLMFFAIRTIPQFKWLLLLLALMPKTIFLFGSLSYDSLTISLSFLAIAVFLHYAFGTKRDLGIRELLVMGALVLLLLLCKPPYFLIGLLFFFIPPKRFGKLYRYLMIGIGVAVVAVVLLKGLPMLSSAGSGKTETSVSADDQRVIRPEEQTKVILNDIPGYLKLIVNSSFVKNRDYLTESFVGLLGWIDVELPSAITWSYLLLILVCAVSIAGPDLPLGVWKRLLLLFILAAGFVVISTAMYVYATAPGRDQVYGIQGRYFIPLAPLFFMLFYNRYISPRLEVLFSPRRQEYIQAKAKAKPALLQEITGEETFSKWFGLFALVFSSVTLIYSVYITLIRYYNI